MQHRGRWDRHLRRDRRHRLQEAEVLQHRMAVEAHLARRSFSVCGLVSIPWNWMPCSASTISTPCRSPRKSKCHHDRRNSPSVTASQPDLLLLRSRPSRIARSSTSRSAAAPIRSSANADPRFLERRPDVEGCRPRRRDMGALLAMPGQFPLTLFRAGLSAPDSLLREHGAVPASLKCLERCRQRNLSDLPRNR